MGVVAPGAKEKEEEKKTTKICWINRVQSRVRLMTKT
jgi:hypothetical protein